MDHIRGARDGLRAAAGVPDCLVAAAERRQGFQHGYWHARISTYLPAPNSVNILNQHVGEAGHAAECLRTHDLVACMPLLLQQLRPVGWEIEGCARQASASKDFITHRRDALPRSPCTITTQAGHQLAAAGAVIQVLAPFEDGGGHAPGQRTQRCTSGDECPAPDPLAVWSADAKLSYDTLFRWFEGGQVTKLTHGALNRWFKSEREEVRGAGGGGGWRG